jgi:regulator of protease activity HflC (stomatin/prohibitin superfamily)
MWKSRVRHYTSKKERKWENIKAIVEVKFVVGIEIIDVKIKDIQLPEKEMNDVTIRQRPNVQEELELFLKCY